ncbi:MAG: bifunctional transaldolase/phosoglucose isomerase [Anaerolineales bacterium]|nr:bifunctional transaldolase/phosoglucose isomerase [Anaerolineales bacterium]
MNPIQHLHSLGQSLWLDNIQRSQLENGEFAAMIARGDIRGVTSNPSIFHNAIAKSHDYDAAILPLAWSGWNAGQIFWQLAIEDIRAAADLFLPLYNQSEGADGYVSLEVSPYLAHDTLATLEQAKHLWETVARSNLMIKIPATKEGLPAIRQAIAAGINVNVTLIFSIQRYQEVMEAYLSGLEDYLLYPYPTRSPRGVLPPTGTMREGAGGDALSLSKGEVPASVASFFISRVDTKVDGLLPEGSPLRGKVAIANSKLAYEEFLKVFSAPRFAKLQMAGCRLQRPLWASTSTKNPAYPDTLYVDELIGPATVNTVPPQTLEAFRAHGKADVTLMRGLEDAHQVIAELEAAGISMAQVTQELEDEGVKAFADAFTDLLKTIDDRRQAAVTQLGPLPDTVKGRVARLEADSVPQRLQDGDAALWTTDPQGQAEIRKRLAWLGLPETSPPLIRDLRDFADQVRLDGFTGALLLGMGGSSLAPEVLSLVFPDLCSLFSILDSTDPAQILAAARAFPPEKTLYILSSKSGDTAEVRALFDYFWEHCGQNGRQFIAITDPGTSLVALAKERGFRATFLADPSVGGRYSALTHFGLLPAALMGIDLERLLERADWMARQCAANVTAARNPGLVLGAVLAQAALDGRDKLTFIADEGVAPLGAWLEQLVAESSGKQGKGILPVDGEPPGDPAGYGEDRLFVYLRSSGERDSFTAQLRAAGHPTLEFLIPDPYSLFSEFYRWEYATAVACHILGVNSFDQPDVQDSKKRTEDKIAAYRQNGKLDEGEPTWEVDGVRAFSPGALTGADLAEILKNFLSQARKGDYVAINAYLPRNPDMVEILQELRLAIRKRTGCATTVGFGPRFLHSTGQLHKGGPDTGLFLQITAEPAEDVKIPVHGMAFGTLQRAQALGDYEALAARKRRILRLHFTGNAARHLAQLAGMLADEEP